MKELTHFPSAISAEQGRVSSI